MKQFDIYEYFQLGNALKEVERFRRQVRRRECMFPIFTAQQALDKLAQQKGMLPLSRHAANELNEALNRIHTQVFLNDKGEMDQAKDFDEALPAWWFGGVITSLENFQHVFAAETRATATYFVAQIGIYETSSLADEAINHIPEEHRSGLGEYAIRDYKMAGRCLAFGLHTAAGFHALRAAESVLDEYYGHFAGKARKEPKSWGDYIKALEALPLKTGGPKPSEKTIRIIDQLRDLDRNPIMHPREFLSETDAQVLFNLATSAIVAMVAEMKATMGQTTFDFSNEAFPEQAVEEQQKAVS